MMWENMKGKTKKLYEAMWPENDFDRIIMPSSDKKSSYHFLHGGKDVDERLLEIFSINNEKNKEQFKEKFKMAISGSGQENAKITTLHSSSLCCLLFFYNVNNDNSLTLSLKTNKGEKSVTFTESVFEFKNIVTLNENAPSNVDVVLIGEDETKNKVILFLESKLSEYYLETPVKAKPKFDIGKGYFNKEWKYYMLYKTILEQMRKNCEICIEPNNEEEEVHRLIGEKRFYIKGLMQIFSHYIGIRNLMDGNYYKSKTQDHIYEMIKKGATVILGEIVFHLPNGIAKDELESYDTKYKELATIIASHEKDNSRFEILNELLSYSEFEANEFTLDEKVKEFYRMN